ncbi:MAG TPA: siderophore-interacting protein [Allosphingosinicella sp.]|nr:siderophore-interacting protein [Allosphingosinicella sp.]
MTLSNSAAQIDPRQPQRVRHELRRRKLAVQAVEKISPSMVRVTLSGAELAGFSSLGFDDHVKLLFSLAAPEGGDGEPQFAGRNFTPRRCDAAAGTLVIDFALHDAGPATQWAEQAQPGQSLTVGGPRGSLVIPASYDWHFLVGDDTALPAIARRLEELPEGSRVVAVVEVDSPADKLSFDTRTDASKHWVYRNGAQAGTADLLSQALRKIDLPKGDYYAWVACESSAAKALRTQLLAEHGAQPRSMRAAGYWRRGVADVHDNLTE